MEIDRFRSEHVEAAAQLFGSRLDDLRDDVPGLQAVPAERLEYLLGRLAERGSGVAALADGRLAGYLAGFGVAGVRGPGMAAYVPEWGWAVASGAPPSLFTRLYEAAASEWAARGWLRHLVTAMPLGAPIDRQLSWFGFAPCVMDAFRSLDELPTAIAPEGIDIARASHDDLDGIADLSRLLDHHLTSAPTFIHRDAEPDYCADAGDLLADAARRSFVARAGSEVAAYVCLADEGDGVAELVSRPGVVHVVAAFTRPEWRSRGIAEALLVAALSDVRERGFVAAAVDFETANPLARRFWTRFFSPVAISYERHLDTRLAARAASAATAAGNPEAER